MMPFKHDGSTAGGAAGYRYPPDRDIDVGEGATVEREAVVLWIKEGSSASGRPKIVVSLGVDPERCKLDVHAAAGTISLTQMLSSLGEPQDAEVDGDALRAKHGGRTRLRVWIIREAEGEYAGRLKVKRVGPLKSAATAAAESAATDALAAMMGEGGADDAPF